MRVIAQKFNQWRKLPAGTTKGSAALGWAGMMSLTFTALIGAKVYVTDQAEKERDRVVDQCVLRTESRDQLRNVFIGVTTALGARDETIDLISEYLDEEYPALDAARCQTDPIGG